MNRTNCIDRAGQILIFCIWAEKRLVDLLILKKHPRLIKLLNTKETIPYTMVKSRFVYWKKSAGDVLKEFINEFQPKQDWKENLEGIFIWRDMIAHGYISLYKPYLLYRPDTKRTGKKPYELRKKLGIIKNISEKPAMKFTPLLRLSDDEIFNKMIKVVEEIDQVYFKYEADKLGINYEKIR